MANLSVKKRLLLLLLMFTALFVVRLIFGYITYPDGYDRGGSRLNAIGDFELTRKNYASKRMTKGSVQQATAGVVDQKYEKVGGLILPWV